MRYKRTNFLFKLSLLFCLYSCNADLEKESLSGLKEAPRESISREALKKKPQLIDNTAQAVSLFKKLNKGPLSNQFIISTDFGDLTIELFKDSPLHLANFNYLTDLQYFDDTYFYRVSPEHVIQAGNSDDYNILSKRNKIGSFKIPFEKTNHYHQTGNIAMARSYKNNDSKESAPFEFYIVIGKKYNSAQLDLMEQKYKIKLTAEQKRIYQEIGGSPHLDREHTVIGRVLKGMGVAKEISELAADSGEWPLDNVKIKVRAIN